MMTARMAAGAASPDSLLAAALALASRGWHVFPLRSGDKRPAVHGERDCPGTGACQQGHQGWEQRATTDPARIERCWRHGDYNIGIACGPSGLVVLDLDTPKDGATPPKQWALPGITSGADVLAEVADRADQPLPVDTYTVRTGSGGLHLYYTAPAGVRLGNSAGRLGWLIDTRAAGGYVVAAGSVVTGRRYEMAHEAPTSTLPGWLADALSPRERTPDPDAAANVVSILADPGADKYATAALRGELDNVLDSPAGQHNTSLYTAALKLGRLVAAGMLPRHLVEQALQAAGEQVHTKDGPSQIAATIASGLKTGTRNIPAANAPTTTTRTVNNAANGLYGPLLDWRGREHWASRPEPCRYCAKPTQLRDDNGHASHKICAEQALTDQHDEQNSGQPGHDEHHDGRQVA